MDTLISMLENEEYDYAIPLKSLSEFAQDFAEEDGFDGCWRISEPKGIAYNPDPEHWIEHGYEIIEMQTIMRSL
ncbi:hypothetical protein D3C80_2143620 [compost metagenome]